MAKNDDHLTIYREFFERFAQTVEPDDQLPVRLAGYKLVNFEVVGGIIDWTTQYLTQKQCPSQLVAPLVKIVIEEIRKDCKKQPLACGFNQKDNAYEPLKLMQTVMAKTNEICARYLDNSKLCSLPAPGPPHNITSVCTLKNTRRRMEDRHCIVHDLDTLFSQQEASPSSFYGVFDGHAGHVAAVYSAVHLHQFLAESEHFISNPEQALIHAFNKTDALFLDKCRVEGFIDGTTAVCALLRPKERNLYIAWVGDSQALLAKQHQILQCVNPHKPNRQDERERIETLGGYCLKSWNIWRVNGQLAVSRAIGDVDHKPYVSAEPEIKEIALDGNEDFLILACDGLWDYLSEDNAADLVYSLIAANPDDTDRISQSLVQRAKQEGSTDNITVIVVFLREPSKIAAEALRADRIGSTMDASLDNSNNPFSNSNGATTGDSILSQKSDGLLLNLTDNFKANGDDFFATTDKTNKRLMSEFDGDADLGPETDVDAVDDNSPEAMPWPASRALLDAVGVDYLEPFAKRKPTNEFDLQTQQGGDLDVDAVRDVRDETPTPPADAVHDVSGLVENAVESDSEDEWNYFKGEDANKENISPSQPEKEVADNSEEDDDDDNMSQLNPNAAEFVPVSPTRSNPSPIRVSLLNDEVISQSPMRPTQNELDILLPNRKDFECEIKSRPSEVEAYSNGHDSSDSEHVTTPPIENILNGKSIDEIPEFLPSGTPTKTASISDEFHFGPNAAPFTPVKLLDQSEALSTMAVFGDESTINEVTFIDNQTSQDVSDFLSTSDKEQDPMSMSFYQDKADKNESTNPFEIELNNVHVLPEDLNDFLGELDETMSDLPEHSPLKGVEKVANNDDAIQITDLDKPLEEKELESPIVEDHSELSAKSPEPLVEQEFVDDMLSGIKELPKSPEPVLQEEQITNIIEQLSVAAAEQTHEHTFVLDLDTSSLREVPRDVPQSPIAEETSEISEASAVSEEIQAVEAALQCDNLESKSPEPEIAILLPEAEKEIDFVVPPQEEPLICPAKPEEEPLENLLAKSPEPEMKSPTPIVCPKLDTSDKDLEDSFVMVSDQLPTLQLENNVNFAQEISNAIQETEAAPTPDLVCGDIPPTEIEKVESFLPDVVSPAEPTNPLEALGGILDLNHPLAKCVYPLPNQFVNDDNVIDIQTDNISPEFPEEAIVSPSEESKQSDEVPTAPLVEEVPVVTTAIIEDVKSVVEEVKPEVVVVEKKMKAKSANAVGARKPTPSPKAPVKTTTLNKTTATKVGATAAPAKPKLAAPPTTKPPATKLSPRPRTAPLASTRSLADKKTNGDVKTSARTTTLTATRKPTETKTATTTRLAATRTSPTKPATARPATAPRAAAPAPKPRVPLARPASATTATRSAPASRPIASTLSKTTTTTTTKTTTLPKTTTSTLSSRTAAAAKPRPPTTTSAPLKPRVPLTKTLSKTTPDADKQSKESANKLMASKTTTARTLNSARSPAAATTMRKTTEAKNLISRTAKTTTNSTTTKTAIGKKPAEITRAKTTKTTKIEKPKENGVSAVVTEEISIVNNVVNNAVNESEADLLKDNSPIDNKLLVDNLLIETSKVD